MNFPNRTLYHGDNLPFLRGMDSETVDLVATDPPFNKSKDFHATPDSLASGARFSDRWSWDRDVHPDWVDSIKDNWPGVWAVIEAARAAHGEDMAAFLCWLGVRVMELHRILKPTGSLYLHIDHTAHAYAKALLDGVFGKQNFRNEIVWAYRGGGYLERHLRGSTISSSGTPGGKRLHSTSTLSEFPIRNRSWNRRLADMTNRTGATKFILGTNQTT